MSRMNATERVEYLNNQLANPDNAPERVTELEGYLTTALNTASQTGDIDTQINAATQLLDRMSPEDEGFNEARDNLINLHDSRDLREAELEGDIAKEYGVKIRQALRNDNTDEVARLNRELNTKLGKGETPAQEYERLTNEFIQKVNDGTLVEGTPEFIAAQNAINKKRATINTYGTKNLSSQGIAIAQSTLQDRTNDIVAKNLNMLPSDIDAVLRRHASDGYDSLKPDEQKLYDQIVSVHNNAETQAASEMRSKYADPSSLNYWPEMASVLSGKADGVVLDEEASNAPPEVSTEAVTEQLPGSETVEIPDVETPDVETVLSEEPTKDEEGKAVAFDTGLPVSYLIVGSQMVLPNEQMIKDVRERFPLEGGENAYAKAMYSKIKAGAATYEGAIRDANSLGYPPEWVNQVSNILDSLEQQDKQKKEPVPPPTPEEIFGDKVDSYSIPLGKTATEQKQAVQEKRFGSGLMQRTNS